LSDIRRQWQRTAASLIDTLCDSFSFSAVTIENADGRSS
jgi:hypothetical protein